MWVTCHLFTYRWVESIYCTRGLLIDHALNVSWNGSWRQRCGGWLCAREYREGGAREWERGWERVCERMAFCDILSRLINILSSLVPERYLSEGSRLKWSRISVLRTLTDHKVVTVITGSQDAFLYQKKKQVVRDSFLIAI